VRDPEWDKPFETRVFKIPVVQWPDSIEICGYCTSAQMTPEVVEALLLETEKTLGVSISHTTRKTFPQPREKTIQEEVLLAWKAPRRLLNLSTRLSSPNYVDITASRYPSPKGAAYPVDHGAFRVCVRTNAPRALKVLRRLQGYAEISNAFFARADSPLWWDSFRKIKDSDSGVVFPTLRVASQPGWAIGERFGWVSYYGPRAAQELQLDEAAGAARVHKLDVTPNGGRLMWLTKEPFDFGNEAHRRVYCDLVSALAPQTLAWWPAEKIEGWKDQG
jgi:hypothetical protein